VHAAEPSPSFLISCSTCKRAMQYAASLTGWDDKICLNL
jgi:hypothetical protein